MSKYSIAGNTLSSKSFQRSRLWDPETRFCHQELSADCLLLVYNKWHETELERWLSDHSVPYPTPADRKDLQNLVKSNWNQKVGQPYNDWSAPQLQSYLKSKGADAKSTAAGDKDSLAKQVKGYWTESADSASSAYGSVQNWVFDRYNQRFLIVIM